MCSSQLIWSYECFPLKYDTKFLVVVVWLLIRFDVTPGTNRMGYFCIRRMMPFIKPNRTKRCSSIPLWLGLKRWHRSFTVIPGHMLLYNRRTTFIEGTICESNFRTYLSKEKIWIIQDWKQKPLLTEDTLLALMNSQSVNKSSELLHIRSNIEILVSVTRFHNRLDFERMLWLNSTRRLLRMQSWRYGWNH